jgi:hypothetical protein
VAAGGGATGHDDRAGQSVGPSEPSGPHADKGRRGQVPDLPPYSPDFNPIEQIFAKLKTYLRGAAVRAFTS